MLKVTISKFLYYFDWYLNPDTATQIDRIQIFNPTLPCKLRLWASKVKETIPYVPTYNSIRGKVCAFYTSYIEAVRGVSVMTGTNIGYFPWVSFPAKLILHIKLTFSLDVLGTSKETVQERPFKCNKLYCNYRTCQMWTICTKQEISWKTLFNQIPVSGEGTSIKGSRHGAHQCYLSRMFWRRFRSKDPAGSITIIQTI